MSPTIDDLRKRYITVSGPDHFNPDEEFDYYAETFSAADLALIGKVFLDLAEWKLSYGTETPGVTRGNQDGARALGAEFPPGNSVTEFPEGQKRPILALCGQ